MDGWMDGSSIKPPFIQPPPPPPHTHSLPIPKNSYSYAAVVLAQFHDRPDKQPVLKRLGFESIDTALGIGGCFAVVAGFLLVFALNAYDAVRPTRPRLRALTPREAGRAASLSFVGERGGLWGAGVDGSTPLLLEEGRGDSPGGIDDEEEEEEEEEEEQEEEGREKGGKGKEEEGEPLSLDEFRRRSASLPPGNGGALYFRDVGYRLSSSPSKQAAAAKGGVGAAAPLLAVEGEAGGGTVILHGGITGGVQSGEMLAVMGPSGAGE